MSEEKYDRELDDLEVGTLSAIVDQYPSNYLVGSYLIDSPIPKNLKDLYQMFLVESRREPKHKDFEGFEKFVRHVLKVFDQIKRMDDEI